MRALHLLKTSIGASWALRQTRELVRAGIEVHVALPDGPLVRRYRAAGCTVHVAEVGLSLRSPRRAARAIAEVRRVVDVAAPDLVHSHFVNTTVAMRIALGRNAAIPRVFQVPGPLHLENAAVRAAEIGLAGEADYWIGSCRWTCDRYVRSGVPADRVYESVYGVDVAAFVPGRPAAITRAALGLAPTTRVIGMVAYMYAPRRWLGQRHGLKGHEDLIEALVRVRARGHDVVGVFVGGAWDGAVEYEQQVRAYGAARLGEAARFLGTREDVPDLYEVMDLVVHPSHSENLGGASESLLLGRPTIATWVGGLPDLVRDGDTGWLVPPHAPGALADAIVDALATPDEAARRAARGRELATWLMDVRRTGAEVAAIYEKVLAHHRGRRA